MTATQLRTIGLLVAAVVVFISVAHRRRRGGLSVSHDILSKPYRSDVRIRPWAEGDLQLLLGLLGDPAMTVHIGGPETPDAIRAGHRRYLDSDDPSQDLFAILVGPDETAVGWVGHWRTSWQGEDVLECGWHVLLEFQGRGVATAGTALMVQKARAAKTHRFMHAFPSVDNASSNALCRTLGFTLLGEVDVEYPPGSIMHSNDWRLALLGDREGAGPDDA